MVGVFAATLCITNIPPWLQGGVVSPTGSTQGYEVTYPIAFQNSVSSPVIATTGATVFAIFSPDSEKFEIMRTSTSLAWPSYAYWLCAGK